MNRLDRLKEQHPDLNISLIDIISALDPTESYKYTEFLIKVFKNSNNHYDYDVEKFKVFVGILMFGNESIETLNKFETHLKANRIKNKDISSFDSFDGLKEEVKYAEEIEKRKKAEKQTLKIHEDDTWLVLTPLSFEASQVYGSNTKWCTTQERYWEKYLKTHRLIYCINKKTDTKIAFSRNYDDDKFQAWNADDSEVNPMFIDFIPDEIFLKIRKELQKNERTIDLIYGETRNKPVSISDIINIHQGNSETTNYSSVLDRIRSLMGDNPYNSTWTSINDSVAGSSNEITINSTDSPRRISDYPKKLGVDYSDYMKYFIAGPHNH